MKCKYITFFICFICIICMMICMCSCKKKNICIREDSFFSSFKVQDEKVYIYCTLFIDNPTEAEKSIALQALLENDVENGLLKEALIDAYSIDENTKHFQLQKGENRLEVVFIGEHAGGYKKHDRALPVIKILETY